MTDITVIEPYSINILFTNEQLQYISTLDDIDYNNSNTNNEYSNTNNIELLYNTINPYIITEIINELYYILYDINDTDLLLQCITNNNYLLIKVLINCYTLIPLNNNDTYNILLDIIYNLLTLQPKQISNYICYNIKYNRFIRILCSEITVDSSCNQSHIFNRTRLLYYILLHTENVTKSITQFNENTILITMSNILHICNQSKNNNIVYISIYCLLLLNQAYNTNNNNNDNTSLLIYLYQQQTNLSIWSIISQELVELINSGVLYISNIDNDYHEQQQQRYKSINMINSTLYSINNILQYTIHNINNDLPILYTTDLYVLIDVIINQLNEGEIDTLHNTLQSYIDTLVLVTQYSEYIQSIKSNKLTNIINTIQSIQSNYNNDKLINQQCSTVLHNLNSFNVAA